MKYKSKFFTHGNTTNYLKSHETCSLRKYIKTGISRYCHKNMNGNYNAGTMRVVYSFSASKGVNFDFIKTIKRHSSIPTPIPSSAKSRNGGITTRTRSRERKQLQWQRLLVTKRKTARRFPWSRTMKKKQLSNAIIAAFKTIATKHRNLSIAKYVGNVKDYYCSQKRQFLSLYAHKYELREKDKENQCGADVVAAEEIARGIARSRKRLAELQENVEQPQEKILKTNMSSPSSSTSYSSYYSSTVPTSPSTPRFLNPDTDLTIDINEIRNSIKEKAKTLRDVFVRGTALEPAQSKRMSLELSSIIDFGDSDEDSQKKLIAQNWNPLLRKMTNIHNNIILIKGVERTNPYSQYMKRVLYSNQKKVSGHKIDLRFVANSSDGSDVNVGALHHLSNKVHGFEATKALPLKKKKAYDSSKLLIESKDVVDLSTNSTISIQDICMLSGTGFQVGGLTCQTSDVYFYRKYVYIAIPRFSFEIPSNIQSLKGFEDTFEHIKTLIVGMEKLAGLIKESKEFFDSDHRSFKYASPTSTGDVVVDYSSWIAPSWYPPIKKDQKKAKVPEDDDASSTASEPIVTTATANTTLITYDPDLVDEYGWVQIGDEYYNVDGNLFLEKHPFDQDKENKHSID